MRAEVLDTRVPVLPWVNMPAPPRLGSLLLGITATITYDGITTTPCPARRPEMDLMSLDLCHRTRAIKIAESYFGPALQEPILFRIFVAFMRVRETKTS